MVVKVYVEGGGDSRDLKNKCRRGFSLFLKNAGVPESAFQIIAGGSRARTYGMFCDALNDSGENLCLLLVDSEAPVNDSSKWKHLGNHPNDKWKRPQKATEDNVFLMVQIMESWFLADPDALKNFYGKDFAVNALGKNANIEKIGKEDVLKKLGKATGKSKKGKYNKGNHSFEILAEIDPKLVAAASPHCKRFLECLRK